MMIFEIYKDTSGGWRWRLIASNGKIVADSGEAYDSKSNAKRAAETVRDHAHGASIVEP